MQKRKDFDRLYQRWLQAPMSGLRQQEYESARSEFVERYPLVDIWWERANESRGREGQL